MSAVRAGRTSLRIAATGPPTEGEDPPGSASAGQPAGAGTGTQRAPAEARGTPAARHRSGGQSPRSIDDPCSEGGYDDRCRDDRGRLCHLHAEHCLGPDYPCLDLLRHQLAIAFLEELEGAALPAREQADPRKS
jgi:hypothetical protein